MKLVAGVSAIFLTGCSDFLNGAANLADKTHGMSWPGAFFGAATVASLAYVLGKVFGS